MRTSGWSTQQLAEFVTALSGAPDERSAATIAVERAAEAFDADLAAIICDGVMLAAVGCAEERAPIADLERVCKNPGRNPLDVPGVGRCAADVATLEYPPGGALIVARPAALSREEAGLLRGMARVASLTMRLLCSLGDHARARGELHAIADEQAALRRVALLVARARPPEEVFAAVAGEIGRLLATDLAFMGRYDADSDLNLVASWKATGESIPADQLGPLPEPSAADLVRKTGRAARIDRYPTTPGTIGHLLGIRAVVAAPITVEDRLWGVIVVATTSADPLPQETEERLVNFTELVATAIADTDARDRVRRIAADQTALRRVATLVAQAAPPDEVFAAVAREVGQLFSVDRAYVGRYDEDETIVHVAAWSAIGEDLPFGVRMPSGAGTVTGLVRETGHPARIDRYSGELYETARRYGVGSAVAVPITVAGRAWGVVGVVSTGEEPPPLQIETRLSQFTELVGAAVANAQAQVEVRRFAEDQAAQRRVATLVARAAPPEEVFAAVTEEVGRVLGADFTGMSRYNGDGTATVAGQWTSTDRPSPMEIGERFDLGGQNVTTLVAQTGRPARIDDYGDASGKWADAAATWGFGSCVGVPITVEERLWGVVSVGYVRAEPQPSDIEERLSGFADLVATAIANAQVRVELQGYAEEQAALRRVATLVARAALPEEVFAVVTEEAGLVFCADYAALSRYEPAAAVTVMGAWNRTGSDPVVPVGSSVALDGENAASRVLATGRPARVDHYPDATGTIADIARSFGSRSTVAVPVTVGGRVWGVMNLFSTHEDLLPADTEARLVRFTELVATAIADTEARRELRQVAAEQAALRRVATLVAEVVPPSEVFAAVAREVGHLLSVDRAYVGRFEADETMIDVASWSAAGQVQPVGIRVPAGAGTASAIVRETGRPARIRYRGALLAAAREAGVTSGVAVPITVEGALWGVVRIASTGEEFPPGTEARLAGFTDLVATAIANAEARAALTASRARIVASADDARRRIERDLHDGAQQHLVTLALQLRAAQVAIPEDLDDVARQLDMVASGLNDALDELREFAHGIHPPTLAKRGLPPALRTLSRRSAVPVDLVVRLDERLPESIEIAAYYVVSEALANVGKHAQATLATVDVRADDRHLRVLISDDGVGGAQFVLGSGLVGMRDRIEALDGHITLQSNPRTGTLLSVELPLPGSAGRPGQPTGAG